MALLKPIQLLIPICFVLTNIVLSISGLCLAWRQVARLSEQANENPPKLHTHDRYGHRIDKVGGTNMPTIPIVFTLRHKPTFFVG
jgi:hypothetical protein